MKQRNEKQQVLQLNCIILLTIYIKFSFNNIGIL